MYVVCVACMWCMCLCMCEVCGMCMVVSVCAQVHANTCHTAHVQVRDTLQELVLSSYHVGPGCHAQAVPRQVSVMLRLSPGRCHAQAVPRQ